MASMKAQIFLAVLGLIEQVIVWFCLGFTMAALSGHINDGAINILDALIVGCALALIQIGRFAWDAFRDIRDLRLERPRVSSD
jgi:hypothetical protein